MAYVVLWVRGGLEHAHWFRSRKDAMTAYSNYYLCHARMLTIQVDSLYG